MVGIMPFMQPMNTGAAQKGLTAMGVQSPVSSSSLLPMSNDQTASNQGSGLFGQSAGGSSFEAMANLITQMMSMIMPIISKLFQGQSAGSDGLQAASAPGGSGGASPVSAMSASSPSGSAQDVGASDSASPTSGAGVKQNAKMKELAAAGKQAASAINTPGKCLKGVQDAMDKVGLKTTRRDSAYMMADQLSKDPRFQEIKVSKADIKKLPAGAIVVQQPNGKGSGGGVHGHISITQGNGMESSSTNRGFTDLGSSYKVFIPKG